MIVKHDDPLHPGQTIWTYYTHMADLSGAHSFIEDRFPPGSVDVPVRQGELLGYQGIYNGGVNASRVGLHLHFSLVKSDAQGHYLNESVFANTLIRHPTWAWPSTTHLSEAFPLRCLPPPAEE